MRLVTVRAHFSEGLQCICYVPHRSFYVLFHSILKAVLWDQQYLCFLSVDQWFSTRDDSVPGNICQCLTIALVFRAVEARGALNMLRCAGWPPTNRECSAQNVSGDAVRKPCCRWQSWVWKGVATCQAPSGIFEDWNINQPHFRVMLRTGSHGSRASLLSLYHTCSSSQHASSHVRHLHVCGPSQLLANLAFSSNVQNQAHLIQVLCSKH